jgi:hypothetical protein
MRKLALVAFLFFVVLPAKAITVVQSCQTSAVTNGTSATVSCATASGNFLVIETGEVANNTSTVTISDSTGGANTWLQTASGYASQGATDRHAMFFVPNATGVTSITAAWTGGLSTRINIVVLEVSGMAFSSAEDSSVNNSQVSGTTATSGALTTTNASDLLVMGVGINATHTADTAGAGYTIPANGVSARETVQYKIVAVTQAGVTTTMTWTTAATTANIFAGFKGAPTSGAVLGGKASIGGKVVIN